MRNVFACLIFSSVLAAMPAAASPDLAARIAEANSSQGETLDALFAELKRETGELSAKRIAESIQKSWTQSGSATVDLLMGRASDAMKEKKFDLALDMLDQAIMLQPDFAEGWNRRATVHAMMHNFTKSMADIERTLELEPRHFGALAGMAQILAATGRDELALAAYERVLAIYPMMRPAQKAMTDIADKLAGEGI